MNEYINKTKFLEQLNKELSEVGRVHYDNIDLEKQMYEFVIKKVEEMQSVNVGVIRCKNCYYYDSQNDYCNNFDFDPPSDTFYCRDSTRKDE